MPIFIGIFILLVPASLLFELVIIVIQNALWRSAKEINEFSFHGQIEGTPDQTFRLDMGDPPILYQLSGTQTIYKLIDPESFSVKKTVFQSDPSPGDRHFVRWRGGVVSEPFGERIEKGPRTIKKWKISAFFPRNFEGVAETPPQMVELTGKLEDQIRPPGVHLFGEKVFLSWGISGNIKIISQIEPNGTIRDLEVEQAVKGIPELAQGY